MARRSLQPFKLPPRLTLFVGREVLVGEDDLELVAYLCSSNKFSGRGSLRCYAPTSVTEAHDPCVPRLLRLGRIGADSLDAGDDEAACPIEIGHTAWALQHIKELTGDLSFSCSRPTAVPSAFFSVPFPEPSKSAVGRGGGQARSQLQSAGSGFSRIGQLKSRRTGFLTRARSDLRLRRQPLLPQGALQHSSSPAGAAAHGRLQ